MIRASGGGENPSDTAIFTKGPDGTLMVMFTSNKLAIADVQANSTLNKELENALELLSGLAKGGQYSKEQLAAGEKGLKASKSVINKIEKDLTRSIGNAMAEPALKDPRIRREFVAKLADAAPGEKTRWVNFKKSIGTEDDMVAAKRFFEEMTTRTPTKDEAKILTRVLEGIEGVPSAPQISAVSRGKIIDSISDTRKIMDKIKGKNGMGLGTTIEAENLIDKLHLEAAFKGSTVGVHAYPGLYEANMGGTRVNGELLAKCIGANNREQFIQNFAIEDPQPVTDKQGNITGAKSETFYEDDQGRITKIGKREVRSKQGISGTLETSYKYTGETQRCLKAGGKTNEEVNMRENLNGPGEKTKSGGLARGGRISQKPQQGGQQGQGGQYGAGAGAVGPEPQAQSGSPNPDEEELEKDYLEMDDEPLQPQSPLGKLIAKEFDKPVGEPKGEESDEKPDEEGKPEVEEEGHRNKSSRQGRSKARAGKRQVRIDRQAAKRPVKEAGGSKFVASYVTKNGVWKGRIEREGGMSGKVTLYFTNTKTGEKVTWRGDSVKAAKRMWADISKQNINEAMESTRGKVHFSARPPGGKFSLNVYGMQYGKGEFHIPRMKAVLVITNDDGKEREIPYPTVSRARKAATEFYVRHDIREDYDGQNQTVTDADGKEIEVDEDAYKTAQKTEPTEVQQMDAAFTVQTKEGPAEGKAGDYLAKGVDGEQWPIDQAIFDKTHEFVDPEIQSEGMQEAEGEKDARGGYSIETYKGWKIWTLPSYQNPYYYASSVRSNKTNKQFFGSSDSYRTLRTLKNAMDKYLKMIGKTTMGEGSLSHVSPGEGDKWAAVRRKDGKPVTVTVPKEAAQPSAREVHDKSLRDPKFRHAIDTAHKDIKSKNKSKVRAAFEFLKHNGLLGIRYSDSKPKTWQDVWKGEAVATKSHKMTPARAQVLNRYNEDPKFKQQLDYAWSVWRSGGSAAEKKQAAKFLKSLGLVEAMREAMQSSSGGPRSMKRTSGSTEWGKTRKKGKTSSGNLRRSATKRARRQGKEDAQQNEAGFPFSSGPNSPKIHWKTTDQEKERTHKGVKVHSPKQANLKEGTITKVRPDLWAAKNALGEVKHFTAPKIATMFANSKGNGTFGTWTTESNVVNIEEAIGGRWANKTRHFQPEGDAGIKTAASGMVSVDEEGSGSEFLGKDVLNPEEMKVIDTHWKNILRFAKTAFKAKPLPVALRAIEGYLEKLGVDEAHTMKIGEILAAQLNKDRDPISMIIPKVIPKIQQEPYSKGSGYNVGGGGGMGPT